MRLLSLSLCFVRKVQNRPVAVEPHRATAAAAAASAAAAAAAAAARTMMRARRQRRADDEKAMAVVRVNRLFFCCGPVAYL